MGFVSQHGQLVPDDPGLITVTPGVQMAAEGDALGQQYRTPEAAVADGADVIIVGRGVYQAADVAEAARRYQAAGWAAYTARLAARGASA